MCAQERVPTSSIELANWLSFTRSRYRYGRVTREILVQFAAAIGQACMLCASRAWTKSLSDWQVLHNLHTSLLNSWTPWRDAPELSLPQPTVDHKAVEEAQDSHKGACSTRSTGHSADDFTRHWPSAHDSPPPRPTPNVEIHIYSVRRRHLHRLFLPYF